MPIYSRRDGRLLVAAEGRSSGRTYRMLQQAVHYACVNCTGDENPTVVIAANGHACNRMLEEVKDIAEHLGLSYSEASSTSLGTAIRVDGNVITFRSINDYPTAGVFVDHWVQSQH